MGYLLDGIWQADESQPANREGRYVRADSQFRNWVTPDGAPGPSGTGGFAAEPGRYHLYVSLACPWAHRTLIARVLKGLQGMIGVSVVHWLMREEGWTFAPGPGVVADDVLGKTRLYEIYRAAQAGYSGRVTVPVLWDKARGTIVNNESAEILRMLGSAFDGAGATPLDLYPAPLRKEIDSLNARIYDTVNNGVYKAGFARSQEAYEGAVGPLFETLEWLDHRLADRPFLCGDSLTEADIRLFTTLVRFDAVYVGHFKCNLRRLIDFRSLPDYVARIFAIDDVASTVDLHHIKHHYYESHRMINPTGIVPRGPERVW